MSEGPDMTDREGLAAEYVLGTLSLPERLQAERLIASDPAFAELVQTWETHLAPLNGDYAEIAPPATLLPKIEARLFPTAPPARRWALFGALAAALAALFFFVILPYQTQPALITATLTGENQPLIVQASFNPDAHEVTFTRADGPAAGPGKDYELWVIPAGQGAISLGVLADGAVTVPLDALPQGTTFAVTLEQTGGSPTGQAQGPLLVAATIGES